MTNEDKQFALYNRAESAWMTLMDMRQLVNSYPGTLPLSVATETELKRSLAEITHLLERSEEAARAPGLARAAE